VTAVLGGEVAGGQSPGLSPLAERRCPHFSCSLPACCSSLLLYARAHTQGCPLGCWRAAGLNGSRCSVHLCGRGGWGRHTWEGWDVAVLPFLLYNQWRPMLNMRAATHPAVGATWPTHHDLLMSHPVHFGGMHGASVCEMSLWWSLGSWCSPLLSNRFSSSPNHTPHLAFPRSAHATRPPPLPPARCPLPSYAAYRDWSHWHPAHPAKQAVVRRQVRGAHGHVQDPDHQHAGADDTVRCPSGGSR
jgi:hypothetical protein